MIFRFIFQPPFALMVGLEAIGVESETGKTIVEGVALHFLLFSIEINWGDM
tara:strand:- start:365 stop:517 length:153 start_codon:yes stop_codon:yes gene_type:complete